MHDPIGPGTPAWHAFDNALEAFQATPKGTHYQHNRTYKRYANHRDYMVRCLQRAGAPPEEVTAWKASLRERCTQPE